MESQFIVEFLQTLLRELSRKRLVAVLAFCLTSLAVLAVGMVWPLQYQTAATIYVDERNIIQPLLEGQAAIRTVNRAEEAKDKIYTRKILEKVARDAKLLGEDSTSKEIAAVLAQLGGGALGYQSGIQISNSGKNYIRVSYLASDPETSFNVVSALINAFIRNIADSKRSESKDAYEFIQKQADVYKQQLKLAEEKLKDFNAENRDGTEDAVNQRISELRSEIEELRLSIDEINSRRTTVQSQLKNEREYLNVRTKSDVYRQRIKEAQSERENLLISLTETHPDVVSLNLQIEDLRQAVIDIQQQEAQGTLSQSDERLPLNPLYEQLRRDLSDTEIALNSAVHREKTLSKILADEYLRAERIASRRAVLSELNRDYNVTRGLYEDMLSRKEKARLSMTLDIEGQGTSYKVHEPPTFPLAPSGMNAKQIAMAGPLVGLLAPIGIIAVFIFLDPRIRLPSDLAVFEDYELLAVASPVKTNRSSHQLSRDNLLCSLLLVGTTAAYTWIVMTQIIEVA